MGEGLEEQKPCRFGTCVDLFACNHLDEDLPTHEPAWDDSEVCQRLELATIKESMEELESVVEFVKVEVEEFVSSESVWLKEDDQGPPEALEPRGLPLQRGFAEVCLLSALEAAMEKAPQTRNFLEEDLPRVSVSCQAGFEPGGALEPRGRHPQKGSANDHLPAQAGSSAPILGEGQEQKKEEVLPGFSRCRPEGRVADPRPVAKVSNHSLLLEPKMMQFPSLKFCHPMCGPTSEPKLTPHLSPAVNPDALES